MGTGCPEACVGLLVGPRARSQLLWALVCRQWDCGFLESGVCPLVAEAGLVIEQASWGAGPGTLLWWMELGLGPSLGRAASRYESEAAVGLEDFRQHLQP